MCCCAEHAAIRRAARHARWRQFRGDSYRTHLPAVIARDGEGCALCGDPIDLTLRWPHPLSRSLDHVVPRALGGSNDLDNLRLAHVACNRERTDRFDILDVCLPSLV